MRDTIAMLGERVTSTRVGRGEIVRMPISGVIATAFDHYDSRAACTRPPCRCRQATTRSSRITLPGCSVSPGPRSTEARTATRAGR
ncbi:relaxase domain-containing protein [Auritidibacter ignavus]|uniref:relaxase domain-containing protein n=1 Tax=Auritidibacter ignavus TaxID=678932 RepID=UPI0024BB4884|nr:relaxase domain-containing protein [Auritidibacter ignavus]WHS29132.1 relaxase domain-containing protein [Auritidibacter ignavus]